MTPSRTAACRGVAGGAEAKQPKLGQRVSLVPGTGDSAGQFQGLLVRRLSLREVTADPVQLAAFTGPAQAGLGLVSVPPTRCAASRATPPTFTVSWSRLRARSS